MPQGTDVVMPQMGESIFEGTITKWLKKVGDPVEKDEPLFEISTDKVDAEIPSPVAGVLTEIKIPEGATVEINTVVAVIGGAPAVAQPEVLPPSMAARTRLRRRPAPLRLPRKPRQQNRQTGTRDRHGAHPVFAAGAADREGEQPRPWPRHGHRVRRPHYQGRHPPAFGGARIGLGGRDGRATTLVQAPAAAPLPGEWCRCRGCAHHRAAHGGERAAPVRTCTPSTRWT